MNGLYDTNADDCVYSFSPGQYAMVLGIAGSYLSPYFALPRVGLVVLIAEQPSLKNYSKSMVYRATRNLQPRVKISRLQF